MRVFLRVFFLFFCFFCFFLFFRLFFLFFLFFVFLFYKAAIFCFFLFFFVFSVFFVFFCFFVFFVFFCFFCFFDLCFFLFFFVFFCFFVRFFVRFFRARFFSPARVFFYVLILCFVFKLFACSQLSAASVICKFSYVSYVDLSHMFLKRAGIALVCFLFDCMCLRMILESRWNHLCKIKKSNEVDWVNRRDSIYCLYYLSVYLILFTLRPREIR